LRARQSTLEKTHARYRCGGKVSGRSRAGFGNKGKVSGGSHDLKERSKRGKTPNPQVGPRGSLERGGLVTNSADL